LTCFTREQRAIILFQYQKKVDEIAEQCEWKATFGVDEIVNMILDIVEEMESEIGR
jgi:hypothetical protein